VKVLITGAGGFVGGRLANRLMREGSLLPHALEELVLLDVRAPAALDQSVLTRDAEGPRVRWCVGDLTDATVLGDALSGGADYVFHLASIPGGATETNPDRGRLANLDGTRMLLDALRTLPGPPIVVFASTIGVFGVPMPEVIDEDTYPAPSLSYGAHKWIGEILIGDYSRRGWIDGRALRLPGIVARPQAPSGQLSAFLSNILHDLSAGREFVCPVAASGKTWWMSVECCIDNLLHAARMRVDPSLVRRVWMLPVLHASLGEVVAAIAQKHGTQMLGLVRYEPNEKLQAQFANYPPLRCPRALAAGFRHDGDLPTMIARALSPA
jgi:nucleoside-diphosphate-sugar epimerase